MIGALGLGLFLGFAMSVPPGPISIAVIRKGIDGDRHAGNLVGLGAALVDVLYALLAVFASSAIVGALSKFFNGNPWYLLGFQILCVAVLVTLGVRYIRSTPRDAAESERDEERKESTVKRLGAHTALMVGAGMAVMNLANPTFIPSMIAVAGYLHAESLIADGFVPSLLYGVGFGGGVYLWFGLLLKFVLRVRSKISLSSLSWIFRIAGGAFLLFALLLLFKVATTTEWDVLLA